MRIMYTQMRGQSDVAVRKARGLPLLVQLSCCSTFLLTAYCHLQRCCSYELQLLAGAQRHLSP